jgi:hypothetical protein
MRLPPILYMREALAAQDEIAEPMPRWYMSPMRLLLKAWELQKLLKRWVITAKQFANGIILWYNSVRRW